MGAPVALGQDIPADELRRLARHESHGRVPCRLIALANALGGMSREAGGAPRREGPPDAARLDDPLQWRGVAGLQDRPKSGRPTWLDEGRPAAFKALVLRGPDAERDGG